MINGPEMFEERIENFLKTDKNAKLLYQTYDKDAELAFILVFVTPLMIRVHQKVSNVYNICTLVIIFYQ